MDRNRPGVHDSSSRSRFMDLPNVTLSMGRSGCLLPNPPPVSYFMLQGFQNVYLDRLEKMKKNLVDPSILKEMQFANCTVSKTRRMAIQRANLDRLQNMPFKPHPTPDRNILKTSWVTSPCCIDDCDVLESTDVDQIVENYQSTSTPQPSFTITSDTNNVAIEEETCLPPKVLSECAHASVLEHCVEASNYLQDKDRIIAISNELLDKVDDLSPVQMEKLCQDVDDLIPVEMVPQDSVKVNKYGDRVSETIEATINKNSNLEKSNIVSNDISASAKRKRDQDDEELVASTKR